MKKQSAYKSGDTHYGLFLRADGKLYATANAVQNAIDNVRKLFPGPASCVTGMESFPVYEGNGKWGSAMCGDQCTYIKNAIGYMQATLDDWHIPRGEQDYMAAYNQVMGEYTDYYNGHCITQSNGTTGTTSNTTGVAASLPSTAAKSIVAASAGKVPLWAWLTAGGIVVAVVIIAVVKNRSKTKA